MVDASGVNWHLRLTWLSLLRVVLIERPHGLHQFTCFWQAGLDGQDAGTPELLAQATLAQAATMVRAFTSEFCRVDWALLPLSTRG